MNFLAAVLSVSMLLFVGRILGFVREWLLARRFGADAETDMAIVLITLPDLLVGLILSGGFAATMIPTLKRFNPPEATRFFLQIAMVFFVLSALLALGLTLFSREFIYLLAPGLSSTFVSENLNLFRLTTLAVPLAALSGLLKTKLDSKFRFVFGASGTLIFNTVIIISLLTIGQVDFLWAITIGVVGGAFGRVLFQLLGLVKTWVQPARSGWLVEASFIKNLISTIGFASLLVMLPVIARSIASLEFEGALSLFNYAFKLMELPVALVIGAISIVLTPKIAVESLDKDPTILIKTISQAIRNGLMISIAIAIPVVFFAQELVGFVFGATALSIPQLDLLAQMVKVAFISFPFRSILLLYIPILVSKSTRGEIFVATILILSTLISVSFLLGTWLGAIGPMIAYAAANCVGVIYLSIIFVRHFGAGIIAQIFEKIETTFIIPLVGSILVCYLCRATVKGVLPILLVSLASVVTYLVLWMVFDKDAKSLVHSLWNKRNAKT